MAHRRGHGKRIGFTSGVFDLLHPGHVDYLEKARAQCDCLIVGVNSDSSVKQYKGQSRPVCGEQARLRVLAGLACVDFVFLFDERRNAANIELLKPDFYFKAGDYAKDELTSAKSVEAYGGKVVIIPMLEGFSSTAIIERIELISGGPRENLHKEPCRAVFIDRDGTINEEIAYLHEPEKFKLIPGALEAMKQLQDGGFKLIVVTNQPGVGLGYYEREDMFKVNRELLRAAGKAGLKIYKVYYCPHSAAEECRCRKPQPGMLLRGKEELNVDLSQSYMIGDMTSDVQAGINAGCKTILVKTGTGGKDKLHEVKPDYVAQDLSDAARWIVRRETTPA